MALWHYINFVLLLLHKVPFALASWYEDLAVSFLVLPLLWDK